MGYALPTTTGFVSCSWQCHKNRNPPSTEPGTDYGVGYGQPVYAPGNGVVSDRSTSNGGGTGRYVTVDMDDGRRTRSLHMSQVTASVGQRVSRGQVLGKSGGSGYGDDWYYGPHVHQTLWGCHCYSFCSTNCTMDFALYVDGGGGGGVPGPTQRQVGSNVANGRGDPSTNGPVVQTLAPGTIADFNGWINGQVVEGNAVWFRGAHSGDWFWSGGFTDKGTHDLADLNTAAMEPNQRKATADLNGRAEPNTTSAVISTLANGAVGTFDGWIYGQTVDGENRWLHGANSGAWYSLKYLTPANTNDLADMNTAPPAGTSRTAGVNSVNVRPAPYTTSPVTASIEGGAVVEMNGWTDGEDVQGIKTWFRRKSDQAWAWAGGFTDTGTTGLERVDPPLPPNSNNPAGIPEYDPVYEPAVIGLKAPLGYNADGTPASRALAGTEPRVPIIDRVILHHTGTTSDQLYYFSIDNDRDSCPSYYVRPDGSVYELIRPGHKPAATGKDWNWRSIAFELLDETGDPTWLIPDLAREAVARFIAWLAEFDGEELDGVPVSFKIDRTHVIGHNEALPGSTICPGPDMDADGIVAMAQAFWDEAHPTDPCPECPECPDPDGVSVPRAEFEEWTNTMAGVLTEMDQYLTEEEDDGLVRQTRARNAR